MKMSMLLLEVDEKGVSLESSVFFSQAEQKEARNFSCSFHFTTYASSLLPAGRKEQRNHLYPFSGRTERKKESSVHFTLQHMCFYCYRQDEKSREITFFLSRAEQRGKRNCFCSFHFATYVSSLLQAGRREHGNFLFPLSGRAERSKECFVLLLLYNTEIYLHDLRFFV